MKLYEIYFKNGKWVGITKKNFDFLIEYIESKKMIDISEEKNQSICVRPSDISYILETKI